MERSQLHPSVEKFKHFVKQHPRLIASVREEGNSLQELYEDWFLLGEDDPKWNIYKDEATLSQEKAQPKQNKTASESNWVHHATKLFKNINMDANQIQHHIDSLSKAIASVQGVLAQFQSSTPPTNTPKQGGGIKNPFSFQKD